MKRILILTVLALASLVQANAQLVPGMSYRQVKDMYDAKMYVPQSIDPYNKTVASLVSLFVPGAAQLCMGELGRGIAFVAGEAVLAGILRSAAQTFSESVITDANGNVTGYNDEAKAKSSSTLLLCSVAGYIGVCIWSSCDAAKVAKVKNMYYQDLYGRRASLDVNFEPYFALTPSAATASGSTFRPTAGMSLKMNF